MRGPPQPRPVAVRTARGGVSAPPQPRAAVRIERIVVSGPAAGVGSRVRAALPAALGRLPEGAAERVGAEVAAALERAAAEGRR